MLDEICVGGNVWLDANVLVVPVDVADVVPNPTDGCDIALVTKSPFSGLTVCDLFVALLFDDVEVILQTDTAFFLYFLSRRVVPLVIPTS